jgi:ABC-2 type transport system ATP-binding protein
MLNIKDLFVSYGDHQVLNGLNLNLDLGKIHGLAGLNGSGKSTLLNTIFGFIKSESGTITLNNASINRTKIGYLETNNYLYHRLSIREYLELFLSNEKTESRFDIEGWLNLFNLSGNEFTEELSTGMRKKVAFLCLLAQNKEVLLLDEPFNGLDMESVQILNLVMAKLRSVGKTIVITSHIIETLTGNCDYIHTLVKGQIEDSFAKDDFQKLNAVFLGDFLQGVEKRVLGLF